MRRSAAFPLQALLLLGLASLPIVLAAAPQQTGKAAPDSREGAVTAILVDVVVRDKSGNIVKDLREDEFQIVEDGVPQEIGSFTPIFKGGGDGGAAAAPSPAAPAAIPARSIPGADAVAAAANAPGEALALVFDRLGPEARSLAYKAALGYAGNTSRPERLLAVYGIDLAIVPYQAFTSDVTKVRAAIDRFGNRSTSQFGSTQEQRMDAQDRALRAGVAQANAEGAAAAGGGTGGIAAAATDAQFATMQQRMLQTFDTLERDQRGYSTANALMAVVSSMAHLPGRKAVMFFSEGLSIPPDAQERFISVIAAANRANVSIYSVDAAGLRTLSTTQETRDEILAASKAMLSRNPSRDLTGEPMMAALERNENNLRLDPHSGLGLLATQTGGRLMSNTNDFRRDFTRMDGDLQNYYMLSYVPSNGEFDGRYREISVKVSRPGVSVLHRKGYYGVRTAPTAPVLSHEAPALAFLDRTPVPNAFPVRTTALRFPEGDRPGLTPIVVELPTAPLTFSPAPDNDTMYRSDTTVLVRIVNVNGDIVDKMSQRYELRGEMAEVERARQGEIIFYRQPDLPPGTYRVETVAYDALGKKASVRFTTIERPQFDASQLRLSTLVLTRRGEKVPESDRIPGSPLYVGDTLLYPNLGTPLKRGVDKELGFYFVAYLAPGGGEARATLQLLKDAQPIASVALPLPAPDAQNRVPLVSRLPVDQLGAGTYELRLVVQQGAAATSQTAPFRMTD